MPIQGAPSPPICVRNEILRLGSINRIAMVWQPIPPPAIWPSNSKVERLCGQPEQKAAGLPLKSFGAWDLGIGIDWMRGVTPSTLDKTSSLWSGHNTPVCVEYGFHTHS